MNSEEINISKDWPKIRKHFNNSFRSNFHVSLSSVNEEGFPDVTPIGSLFLNNNKTGFFFEKYPETISKNVEHNKNICILGVNSNSWFWLKSLFSLSFKKYPAVKLYGLLGEKRKATDIEISRLNKRMKATKFLKGNKYLWGNMLYVRDITFTRARFTKIGKMTENL